jgi:hypothetical protein
MGGSEEEGELIGDEAEKVAAARLVHLPPSVPPTAAGRGGAARAPNLTGIDGYGYREGDGEGDDVWEVSGDGVSSMACLEAPFIGQRREGAGWPKVGIRAACAASMAGTAALGACWHARPRPMVRSCTFGHVGDGRGCQHLLGNGMIFG